MIQVIVTVVDGFSISVTHTPSAFGGFRILACRYSFWTFVVDCGFLVVVMGRRRLHNVKRKRKRAVQVLKPKKSIYCVVWYPPPLNCVSGVKYAVCVE